MLEKGMDYVYVLELVTNKNRKIELVYLPFNFRNKSSFSTEDYYTMHANANKDVFDNIYDEFLQGQTQHKEREKINGQCPYCGSDIDNATQICSTCGAINRNYKKH